MIGLSRDEPKPVFYVRWTKGREGIEDRCAQKLDVPNNVCSPEYRLFMQSCECSVNGTGLPLSSASFESWYVPVGEAGYIERLSLHSYGSHKYLSDPELNGRFSWRPSFSSAEFRAIDREVKGKWLGTLDSIAWVSKGYHCDDEVQPLLNKADVRHPFDPKAICLGAGSRRLIGHGDVALVSNGGRCQALLYEGERVSVGYGVAVISIRGDFGPSVTPEYLCMFFMSNLFPELLKIVGGEHAPSRLRLRDLRMLPVPAPIHEPEYYKAQYEYFSNPQERQYQIPPELKDAAANRGDALDRSLFNRFAAFRKDQLRDLLAGDVRELKTCYRNGAYKTAVIAAGSILGAVLIDWLSEIDQRDYFKELYLKRKANGQTEKLKLGIGLCIDKISAHQKATGGDWGRAKKCARSVQATRSRAHATLSMKKEPVDKGQAGKVITDLKVVLTSRGVTL